MREAVVSNTGQRLGRSRLWRWLPLACVALILLVSYAAGISEYLSLEKISRYQAELAAFVSRNAVEAAIIYVLVYVTAVGLSFPGASVLTAAGGLMFGSVVGTILAAAAATVGATIIFVIARTSLGELLAERAGPRLQKLRQGFAEEAFSYLLFLRLAPLFPFWIVNLAAGLFGMQVVPYVLATAVGILPGTFAFSYLGQNLDSVLAGEGALGLFVAFGLLALMALVPVLLRRRRRAA